MDFSQPSLFNQFQTKIHKEIAPIVQASKTTPIPENFYFLNVRVRTRSQLPPYFMVYFLFVELLQFRNLGPDEKVAWVIPIEYKGQFFTIEHRKFGLGIFSIKEESTKCEEIVELVSKAVVKAKPFFEYLALKAVNESQLNVKNNCRELFDRYEYFLNRYKIVLQKYKNWRDAPLPKLDTNLDLTALFNEMYKTQQEGMGNSDSRIDEVEDNDYHPSIEMPWLAQATIEAFFSWTEHLFIHIAILQGRITEGKAVGELAGANWAEKFKAAIPIMSKEMKRNYEELLSIRRQVRNFVAHGSFGRDFEAFQFHSGAGAVPVRMFIDKAKSKYSFEVITTYDDASAVSVIEKFISLLWKDDRLPAKIYLIDNQLPVLLTFAANGTYRMAMESTENMENFTRYLNYEIDKAANMD